MDFEIISEISNIEIIAVKNNIKNLKRLIKYYGNGRWRKLKGNTNVRLSDGSIWKVEIHWYEAHGIGKKEFKIKNFILL
jgi:hypothetical protein